jgi:GTP-binding protein
MEIPNPFQRAVFLQGAPLNAPLPADRGLEAAFAGRSNSGKSSALNTLTGKRGLARTSRTPGRTQQINFFDLGDDRRLADLPGYGYAKVPEAIRLQWKPLIERYLVERRSLKGLVLTVDCRRDFGELEAMMLDWCDETGMPVHLLLTKSDKLKRGPAHAALHRWQALLAAQPGLDAGVQLFSSLTRVGVDEARERLAAWRELDFGQKKAPV